MKTKILSMWAFVLLALISPAWAADILGRWIAKVPDRQGTVVIVEETVFSFKVDGTRLTGTVTYPQGEAAISEGEIYGDRLSFAVKRNLGGKEIKMNYVGRAGLNEIRFASEVQGESGQRQEFIAKREFLRHNDLPLRRTIAPVPTPR
jgi:hypothetical protein